MNHANQSGSEKEDKYSALLNNAGAIRAICAAVEGTLGPKGLDTMLVGAQGDVVITNDGVTILEKMDVSHPAARLLIQVARSQQNQVGDGTTTATVLAGALVSEGVAQITKGVPVAKVVRGIQDGIRLAVDTMKSRSRPISGLDDHLLLRIAYIAGREHKDIAELVVSAAAALGAAKLEEDGFPFADMVVAHEKANNEVWPGLLICKKPLNVHQTLSKDSPSILVIQDALEPETLDEEAIGTEAGFQRYLRLKEEFTYHLEKLVSLGVGLIAADRGVDREAEQFCLDHGIMVLPRVLRKDLQLICEHTGAKPILRNGLKKAEQELSSFLGQAQQAVYDPKLEAVRITGGRGRPMVALIVGAGTAEIVGERTRIARDAAAAVQAAVRGGCLPGGGAAEIAVAYELDRYRETVKGMEAFGVSAVVKALSKPLAQIVINAGFNPLEKVEEVKAAQLEMQSDAIGIDCDTGRLMDCMEQGIVDPAPVKIHALEAAGEVAGAILRIHSVIKMKPHYGDEE